VDLVLVSYDPDQYYRALHAAARAWRGGTIDAGREAESAKRLDRYWKTLPAAIASPASLARSGQGPADPRH
jgi:hypothetical protein